MGASRPSSSAWIPRRRRKTGFACRSKEARQRLAKDESTRDLDKSYDVSVSTISRIVLWNQKTPVEAGKRSS